VADGAAELRVGEEFLVVGAAVDQRVHQGVAVGRDALDGVAGLPQGAQQVDHRGGRVQSDAVADPGVLRRVVAEEDRDAFSAAGVRRRRAKFSASRATKSTRSAFGDVRPDRRAEALVELASSLKLMATVLIRPSNSGSTTFIAVSRGVSPAEEAAHSAELVVQSTAWSTGTSSRSSRSLTAPDASVCVPSLRCATVKLSVLISTSTRRLPPLVDQEPGEDGRDAPLPVGVVLQAVAEDRQGDAPELLDPADQRVDRRQVPGHPVRR
jgi:hypothetical protein